MLKAAAAVTMLLMASLAHAQSPADVVRAWGLIGKWKVDCAAPDDKGANSPIIYRIEPDGKPVYENLVATSDVLEAKDNSNGTITLQLHHFRPKDEVRTLVIEKVGNGIRALMNRSDRNEYSIRDGILLPTGKEMPVIQKCEG